MALTVWFLFSSGCSKGNSKQADHGGTSGKGGIPVEARLVRSQLLRNTILATGTLMASEEVQLRSEISGRVTGVYFEEGKRVKKGELLLKINGRELKAQLRGKEIEEQQAADEEGRRQKLFEIKAISQEEYDKALNALHKVQAEMEAIESQIAETETGRLLTAHPDCVMSAKGVYYVDTDRGNHTGSRSDEGRILST